MFKGLLLAALKRLVFFNGTVAQGRQLFRYRFVQEEKCLRGATRQVLPWQFVAHLLGNRADHRLGSIFATQLAGDDTSIAPARYRLAWGERRIHLARY
ncbi:hypothetical protein [Xanthomonas translucens]|uniref:hypothetical protein n=1 Tax=Xanthomonas campestris pv. translucens TaxID=343 RepID=UPI0012D81948|nr:hypothetical protein [Xanthomonas translucens]